MNCSKQLTLVPEMNKKSWAREGSKNAIFFFDLSYAATCKEHGMEQKWFRFDILNNWSALSRILLCNYSADT